MVDGGDSVLVGGVGLSLFEEALVGGDGADRQAEVAGVDLLAAHDRGQVRLIA